MFKDLAEFHEARTSPKEDADFLFKVNAKGDDILLTVRRSAVAKQAKLIKSRHLKPLTPTLPPKVLSVGCNPNAYSAFHQMPSHLTDAYFCLQQEIQDLIDNGTVQTPPLSKPNVISNSLPQHNSNPFVSQISITSTQINPSSTIFNPSHYIIPENQPKPIVSVPSEPEVNMMAVGRAIEVFTADIWVDSDEGLANERTDWLRSIDQRSIKKVWSKKLKEPKCCCLSLTLTGSYLFFVEAMGSFV
ncbi:hypothetical protein RHMOL_Rhmol04G0191300 [Rhododendron molle]|uniref:Uncharacterized protein n=1 Tax=Rhododendron molle TaxID=49168 RepID=A0ACC0P3W4_RHOML|nr:hypothetical protein RHMOL_Rhmol04G0191300 [Rhododendron molle]